MKVSFDTDRGRAMEDTKVWAALALPAEQKVGVDDPREMERLAKGVEDIAYKRWLVSDDPDEHVEQIATYVGYGFDHLVFHFPGDDQESGDRALRRADPAATPRALRLTPRLPGRHIAALSPARERLSEHLGEDPREPPRLVEGRVRAGSGRPG